MLENSRNSSMFALHLRESHTTLGSEVAPSVSTLDISGLLGSCSMSLLKLVTFEKLSVTSPLIILCLLRLGS